MAATKYCLYLCFQIAGGTGITPMLQVVRAILKNPDDKTQVSYDHKILKILQNWLFFMH
jgi:hypothetical protein